MADDLEAQGCDDVASCSTQDFEPINNRDFIRYQFQVYKHRFRLGAIDGEQSAIQQGFERGFSLVAPLAQELGKFKGVLTASLLHHVTLDAQSRGQLETLLAAAGALVGRLSLESYHFVEEIQDEATPQNAPLPPFDRTDMELFLGDEEVSVIDGLARSVREKKDADKSELEFIESMKREISSVASDFASLKIEAMPYLQSIGSGVAFEDAGLSREFTNMRI